jgi:hypothetical protein
MNDHYYVIAGNFEQYRAFVKKKTAEALDQKLEYSSHNYVSSPEVFRGMRNPKGYFIGSWRQRNDIREILNQLLICTDDDKRSILDNCMLEIRTIM